MCKKIGYLIFTISILLIHGCKVYTDSGFDSEMDRYSNYCLSYPNSCEDLFRKIYQVDSLNSFYYLHAVEEWADFPAPNNEEVHSGNDIKYNDYNHILDSLFTLVKKMEEESAVPSIIERDWHYMFQNKEHIKIVHKRKRIKIINTKSGECYQTDNIINLEKKYLEDARNVKFAINRKNRLLSFSTAKMYTKDTLQIIQPWESEYYSDSVQIKIFTLLSKNTTGLKLDKKNAHLLHYNRNGELTDFYGKDVPEEIVENKELFEYLNNIFKEFPQAHIIHFRTY